MAALDKIYAYLSTEFKDCIRKGLDYETNYVRSMAGENLSIDVSTMSISTSLSAVTISGSAYINGNTIVNELEFSGEELSRKIVIGNNGEIYKKDRESKGIHAYLNSELHGMPDLAILSALVLKRNYLRDHQDETDTSYYKYDEHLAEMEQLFLNKNFSFSLESKFPFIEHNDPGDYFYIVVNDKLTASMSSYTNPGIDEQSYASLTNESFYKFLMALTKYNRYGPYYYSSGRYFCFTQNSKIDGFYVYNDGIYTDDLKLIIDLCIDCSGKNGYFYDIKDQETHEKWHPAFFSDTKVHITVGNSDIKIEFEDSDFKKITIEDISYTFDSTNNSVNFGTYSSNPFKENFYFDYMRNMERLAFVGNISTVTEEEINDLSSNNAQYKYVINETKNIIDSFEVSNSFDFTNLINTTLYR